MSVSRDTLPGMVNQALYFARIQLDTLEQEQRQNNSEFNWQYRQSFIDASLLQLYRALCGVFAYASGSLTIEQSIVDAVKLRQQLQTTATQSKLAAISLGIDDVITLIDVFERTWSLNASSPPRAQNRLESSAESTSLLLASDRTQSFQQCRDWHRQLTDALRLSVELSQEY